LPTASCPISAEGVEATVPKAIRETVEAVENVIDGWGEEHATNKAVAEELEIDKAAASRRVRTAIGRGYPKNLEERKGRPAQLVLAEDMPEDQEILPAPEDLDGVDPLTVDRGGIYHPPPPSEAQGGGVLYVCQKHVNRSTPARGDNPVNALSLYHDLKARGVLFEAQGAQLKVDAPAGVLTDGHRTALKEHKPKLLQLLSSPREDPQEAPQRVSVARWAGPGPIKIRDPFTGKWHPWPADECLPGVVAEADRLRKGTSLGDSRNRDSPR
jgi:TubC N-terminal docking domain